MDFEVDAMKEKVSIWPFLILLFVVFIFAPHPPMDQKADLTAYSFFDSKDALISGPVFDSDSSDFWDSPAPAPYSLYLSTGVKSPSSRQ